MAEIEKQVKEIIEEVTECKYVGRLKVIEEPTEDSTLWMLLLYLDLELTPMVLAYEGSEEEFKDFIRTEMKNRKLQYVKFWKATKEPINFEDCDE